MSAIQTETDNLYVECLKWKLLYLYFTRKVNSRKKITTSLGQYYIPDLLHFV